MKNYRIKLLTLFMVAAWAVASIAPPITPSAKAGDSLQVGYKHKFLKNACKAKEDHVCKIDSDPGIIIKIIDKIF